MTVFVIYEKEQMANEEAQRQYEEIREYQNDVMAKRWRQDAMEFKEWWDKGTEGDPFFEEKKPAKCKDIYRVLEWHKTNGMDDVMCEWYELVRSEISRYASN